MTYPTITTANRDALGIPVPTDWTYDIVYDTRSVSYTNKMIDYYRYKLPDSSYDSDTADGRDLAQYYYNFCAILSYLHWLVIGQPASIAGYRIPGEGANSWSQQWTCYATAFGTKSITLNYTGTNNPNSLVIAGNFYPATDETAAYWDNLKTCLQAGDQITVGDQQVLVKSVAFGTTTCTAQLTNTLYGTAPCYVLIHRETVREAFTYLYPWRSKWVKRHTKALVTGDNYLTTSDNATNTIIAWPYYTSSTDNNFKVICGTDSTSTILSGFPGPSSSLKISSHDSTTILTVPSAGTCTYYYDAGYATDTFRLGNMFCKYCTKDLTGSGYYSARKSLGTSNGWFCSRLAEPLGGSYLISNAQLGKFTSWCYETICPGFTIADHNTLYTALNNLLFGRNLRYRRWMNNITIGRALLPSIYFLNGIGCPTNEGLWQDMFTWLNGDRERTQGVLGYIRDKVNLDVDEASVKEIVYGDTSQMSQTHKSDKASIQSMYEDSGDYYTEEYNSGVRELPQIDCSNEMAQPTGYGESNVQRFRAATRCYHGLIKDTTNDFGDDSVDWTGNTVSIAFKAYGDNPYTKRTATIAAAQLLNSNTVLELQFVPEVVNTSYHDLWQDEDSNCLSVCAGNVVDPPFSKQIHNEGAGSRTTFTGVSCKLQRGDVVTVDGVDHYCIYAKAFDGSEYTGTLDVPELITRTQQLGGMWYPHPSDERLSRFYIRYFHINGSWYFETNNIMGTVAATPNDTYVSGTDTAFDIECQIGHNIIINGIERRVIDISSYSFLEVDYAFPEPFSDLSALNQSSENLPIYYKTIPVGGVGYKCVAWYDEQFTEAASHLGVVPTYDTAVDMVNAYNLSSDMTDLQLFCAYWFEGETGTVRSDSAINLFPLIAAATPAVPCIHLTGQVNEEPLIESWDIETNTWTTESLSWEDNETDPLIVAPNGTWHCFSNAGEYYATFPTNMWGKKVRITYVPVIGSIPSISLDTTPAGPGVPDWYQTKAQRLAMDRVLLSTGRQFIDDPIDPSSLVGQTVTVKVSGCSEPLLRYGLNEFAVYDYLTQGAITLKWYNDHVPTTITNYQYNPANGSLTFSPNAIGSTFGIELTANFADRESDIPAELFNNLKTMIRGLQAYEIATPIDYFTLQAGVTEATAGGMSIQIQPTKLPDTTYSFDDLRAFYNDGSDHYVTAVQWYKTDATPTFETGVVGFNDLQPGDSYACKIQCFRFDPYPLKRLLSTYINKLYIDVKISGSYFQTQSYVYRDGSGDGNWYTRTTDVIPVEAVVIALTGTINPGDHEVTDLSIVGVSSPFTLALDDMWYTVDVTSIFGTNIYQNSNLFFAVMTPDTVGTLVATDIRDLMRMCCDTYTVEWDTNWHPKPNYNTTGYFIQYGAIEFRKCKVELTVENLEDDAPQIVFVNGVGGNFPSD